MKWLRDGGTVAIAAVVLLGSAVLTATTMPPPVRVLDGPANRGLWVNGNVIVLHTTRIRTGYSCVGAYALRRMVSFWDPPANKHIKDVHPIVETALFDPAIGPKNEWETMHLLSPLQGDVSDYYLLTEYHDNCPLWFRVLPSWLQRLVHDPPAKGPLTQAMAGDPPAH
jgi:hypothetical protein